MTSPSGWTPSIASPRPAATANAAQAASSLPKRRPMFHTGNSASAASSSETARGRWQAIR
ncbi:MAG: hypothetical protein WDM94_11820 [Bauldia sp.]